MAEDNNSSVENEVGRYEPYIMSNNAERYEPYIISVGCRTHHLIQYEYRVADGAFFSCAAKTLEECRRQRDQWLTVRRNGGKK